MASSDDLTTWVKEGGPASGWGYVCTDGTEESIVQDVDSLSWSNTFTTFSLDDLNALVYQTSCSNRDYHFTSNNCHQFAKQLFQKCVDN